jgi:hypothetical protein
MKRPVEHLIIVRILEIGCEYGKEIISDKCESWSNICSKVATVAILV